MNECEQIHPLLRGYLGETLSARERRLVARHLNLCASARKELDRLRSGPVKAPLSPIEPPTEPWDLKILRWMYKTPKPASRQAEPDAKKAKGSKLSSPPIPETSSSSPFMPIFKVILFFGVLILLTHFIQNAGQNPAVKGVNHWLSKNGYHIFGVTSSLDLVLDLTNMSHWGGNVAPVASACQNLITDPDHLKVYWGLLLPTEPVPNVDFTKNAVAFVFLGPKPAVGYTAKFKRMENYTDKTILWYDEVPPNAGEMASAAANRPWVLQLVPKPPQEPVLIQRIQ